MGYVTQSRKVPANPGYWRMRTAFDSSDKTGQLLGINLPEPQQTTYSFRTGRVYDADPGGVDFDGVQTQGQAFKALRHEKGEYEMRSDPSDTGHEFWTVKQTAQVFPEYVRLRGPQSQEFYYGPLMPVLSSGNAFGYYSFPDAPAIDSGWYGPAAVKATQPTASVGDLAVTLAEIRREGIPHFVDPTRIQKGDLNPSKVGGEYLNWEFGWRPLLGEVEKQLMAMTRAKRIMDQYAANSGRLVRRRHVFPVERSTRTATHVGGGLEPISSSVKFSRFFYNQDLSGSHTTESETTERSVWFSGAYQYYLPKGSHAWDTVMRYGQQASHLLGIGITPETVWALQPWSWLVDWNLNVGINISNASAALTDGLVLKYGYLMATTRVTHSVTVDGCRYYDGSSVGPVTATYVTQRKERIRATPYGFGVNPADFTQRQWAILGALGITRGGVNKLPEPREGVLPRNLYPRRYTGRG